MKATPKKKALPNSTVKPRRTNKPVGDPPVPVPDEDCACTGEQLLERIWEELFAASGMETGEEGMVVITSSGFRVVPAPSDTRTLRSGPPAGIDFKAG